MNTPSYLMGLIGEGVRPSLTPPMHEREATAQNLRFVYRPIDLLELKLPATAIGDLLSAGINLGFNAFNVTHPCKQLVLEYLDDIDPAAKRLGACNTVIIENGKLVGYNTDRSGFASALALELPDANLADVVLLGAGGAGSAVADALIGAGTQRLSIIDPQPQRAQALAEQVQHAQPADSTVEIRIGSAADGTQWIPQATGLVNASPIGMFSHPGLPVDVSLLHSEMWVADIVYRPAVTELIEQASALGCAVMPGKAMAVGQAADTFALVTGLVPDRNRMYAHLNELVELEQLQLKENV
ncbi:shikimate dehydrogenase [Enteractinococcus helveticum]|uniref:shikimate dehydrogenase (NADP(+)) n=1 Tax=Enteractinococcus helveticum TaxID=1837282 RepID=A0A1B7M0X7_9MICC|nr:shikimate dehydrogenase [Enteractinococcus helveticum]OAV61874.1 shikimate dehydrogenase [Enteractinococcus helveticum]